jgi:hypothetical protein
MSNEQDKPVKGSEKPGSAKEPVGSPELHLVDLGQVSQDTALTISTGKFEILVRLRKQ